MAGATDLQALAEAVLDASAAILATTAGPPITRAFVSHGPLALDCCDQLAVHVASIGEAPTQAATTLGAGRRHMFGRVNLTALMITVTRCHPVVGEEEFTPSPEELNAAAAMLNDDAWALWNGLYRMRDELFASCDLVFFDAGVPLVPQGGCAGWVFQIRFELPGYGPPVGS